MEPEPFTWLTAALLRRVQGVARAPHPDPVSRSRAKTRVQPPGRPGLQQRMKVVVLDAEDICVEHNPVAPATNITSRHLSESGGSFQRQYHGFFLAARASGAILGFCVPVAPGHPPIGRMKARTSRSPEFRFSQLGAGA
jgi:hypothetical protein